MVMLAPPVGWCPLPRGRCGHDGGRDTNLCLRGGQKQHTRGCNTTVGAVGYVGCIYVVLGVSRSWPKWRLVGMGALRIARARGRGRAGGRARAHPRCPVTRVTRVTRALPRDARVTCDTRPYTRHAHNRGAARGRALTGATVDLTLRQALRPSSPKSACRSAVSRPPGLKAQSFQGWSARFALAPQQARTYLTQRQPKPK